MVFLKLNGSMQSHPMKVGWVTQTAQTTACPLSQVPVLRTRSPDMHDATQDVVSWKCSRLWEPRHGVGQQVCAGRMLHAVSVLAKDVLGRKRCCSLCCIAIHSCGGMLFQKSQMSWFWLTVVVCILHGPGSHHTREANYGGRVTDVHDRLVLSWKSFELTHSHHSLHKLHFLVVEVDASTSSSLTFTVQRFWRMIINSQSHWLNYFLPHQKRPFELATTNNESLFQNHDIDSLTVTCSLTVTLELACLTCRLCFEKNLLSLSTNESRQPSGIYYAPAYGATLDPYLECPARKTVDLNLEWSIMNLPDLLHPLPGLSPVISEIFVVEKSKDFINFLLGMCNALDFDLQDHWKVHPQLAHESNARGQLQMFFPLGTPRVFSPV